MGILQCATDISRGSTMAQVLCGQERCGGQNGDWETSQRLQSEGWGGEEGKEGEGGWGGEWG